MDSPLAAFRAHVEQARAADDPMSPYAVLATIDERGDPAARTVTIRRLDDEGISIFITNHSPKARHLEANGRYELLAFYPSLMVQYRIRGGLELRSDPELVREWSRKNRPSQLADLYHQLGRPQSTPIADHQLLRGEVQALASRLDGQRLEMPDTVSRLVLVPTFMEQWLGSVADRLHRRTSYERQGDRWIARTLVP